MAKFENDQGFFEFNLTADVGKASPNRLDDVELVRFGYFCLGRNPQATQITPRLKAALQRMKSNGPHGPDLQEVIDAHQQARGGTQDGKVSIGKAQIRKGQSLRYDDKHSWIIYILTANMFSNNPDGFPRIDQEIDAGNAISATVAEMFVR